MIKFDRKIKEFISFCNNNNIDIYLVGGAVRDYLLGIDCYDLDFCLTSDYESCLYKLKDKYGCIIDDKYQFIKLVIGEYKIEITHARKEDDYDDYRHPKKIEFITDIEQDSKRRDFTINALYYKDDHIYDFYNGKKDLEDRRLKVIGNTIDRLKEDPLRILRMIRFSCLGFNIESDDKKLILDNVKLVNELSLESFNKEFNKILMINNINVLEEYKSVFETYFNVVFKDLNKLNRFISLDQKKTYLSIKNSSNIYKYKDIEVKEDVQYISKLIYKYGKENIKELLEYYDLLSNTKLIDIYDDIIDNRFYSKKQLDISSKDIIKLINRKELTSYYIDVLCNGIIDGVIKNKKEELIKYILENKDETIV